LRLVNSLLDFSRIEAGRLQTSFAPTDLATLTEGLASSFCSLVERAALRLVVDCPPLPEPVYVDVSQWEKIVLNLVSNAFKFTLRGEIAVRMRWCGDHVELTVQDTGCGIPERELPRMFERFHRVEGAPGRSFEGTGIGLSLVDEFTRIHGGGVRVSSVEGQGSTFAVSIPTGSAHLPPERIAGHRTLDALPRASAAHVLEAMAWTGHEELGAASEAPVHLAEDAAPPNGAGVGSPDGPRVLIADDSSDMRNYLARILGTRWNVDLAVDGQAALEAAREHPPDLVLTDVMMPRLDGLALLRELRADPRTREVPIVLLSARAGEESLLAGIETGADDYLVKPFSARELLARVRTHLNLGRLRRQWASELEAANRELEAFSYSVSHDLRAPLRAIDGFSKALLREYGPRLDEQGRQYLERVGAGIQRMATLIHDLLGLARISRQELVRQRVSLSEIAGRVAAELSTRTPVRQVALHVAEGLSAEADPHLLTIVLENLIGNAWKFTAKREDAVVEVGKRVDGTKTAFYVRDNGAGFDMAYADKLFGAFQRLHSQEDFEGTGIGLATVQRIVKRHGGRIWAEGEVGKGATFYFTLERSL
jgi:signal transduction histidine kinase